MRVALYGNFMFQLAMGLREVSDFDVQVFINEPTIPHCLADEPSLDDPEFAQVDGWESGGEILRPGQARLTERLREFDVAITTDHGPIFGRAAGIPHAFIPSGSDLTQWPFPWRSRSTRRRGLADLFALLEAVRMRQAIRSAAIWLYPYSRFGVPLQRLGCRADGRLSQPIDMETFSPTEGSGSVAAAGRHVRIFHPTRMMLSERPFLIESMGWKRNDLLLRGLAAALEAGVDTSLVLISRQGSHDEKKARALIDELGIAEQVEWRRADHPQGFTWREVADQYRMADLVVDEFGGCLGLVALEGAACGRPTLNFLETSDPMMKEVVDALYPEGHPFLQARDVDGVRQVIEMLVDPGTRESIGRSSRHWMSEHHDRRVVARQCVPMLEELTADWVAMGGTGQ
jgi:glycosyltransferase involved in cell wall biosynthesis